LWNKKAEARINVSGLKKYEYFLNTTDVLRNIKETGSLVNYYLVNYSLIIPLHSCKVNTLGYIFINILPHVVYVLFPLPNAVIHHTY